LSYPYCAGIKIVHGPVECKVNADIPLILVDWLSVLNVPFDICIFNPVTFDPSLYAYTVKLMLGVGVAVIVGVGVTSVAPVGDFLVHETETNDITRAINKAEKKNFFTASLQVYF
jgi:hypothetical protein